MQIQLKTYRKIPNEIDRTKISQRFSVRSEEAESGGGDCASDEGLLPYVASAERAATEPSQSQIHGGCPDDSEQSKPNTMLQFLKAKVENILTRDDSDEKTRKNGMCQEQALHTRQMQAKRTNDPGGKGGKIVGVSESSGSVQPVQQGSLGSSYPSKQIGPQKAVKFAAILDDDPDPSEQSQKASEQSHEQSLQEHSLQRASFVTFGPPALQPVPPQSPREGRSLHFTQNAANFPQYTLPISRKIQAVQAGVVPPPQGQNSKTKTRRQISRPTATGQISPPTPGPPVTSHPAGVGPSPRIVQNSATPTAATTAAAGAIHSNSSILKRGGGGSSHVPTPKNTQNTQNTSPIPPSSPHPNADSSPSASRPVPSSDKTLQTKFLPRHPHVPSSIPPSVGPSNRLQLAHGVSLERNGPSNGATLAARSGRIRWKSAEGSRFLVGGVSADPAPPTRDVSSSPLDPTPPQTPPPSTTFSTTTMNPLQQKEVQTTPQMQEGTTPTTAGSFTGRRGIFSRRRATITTLQEDDIANTANTLQESVNSANARHMVDPPAPEAVPPPLVLRSPRRAWLILDRKQSGSEIFSKILRKLAKSGEIWRNPGEIPEKSRRKIGEIRRILFSPVLKGTNFSFVLSLFSFFFSSFHSRFFDFIETFRSSLCSYYSVFFSIFAILDSSHPIFYSG